MPGFLINGTGGDDPDGPSHVLETRRKHRWRFSAVSLQGPGSGAPGSKVMLVLQKASRPKQSYEEAIMHHNQEEVYFAGKTKWDAITLGFYDAQQDPDSSAAMWDWVNTVGEIPFADVVDPIGYKGTSDLEMLDGRGDPKETWHLYGVWPQSTNWQDLDYTSSEIAMIEVTMRFDRAVRET